MPILPAQGAEGPAPPHSASGVFATDPGGLFAADAGPDGVAAEVDGHPIPLRDVAALCLRKYRAPIIDQMVQNYVLERECKKRGIVVTDAEIKAQVEALRQAVAPAALSEVIARHHSTLPEVQAAFRHKIQRTRLVADQISPVKMVHCRVILIKFAPPGAPVRLAGAARTEADALSLIASLQTQLSAGKSFDDLAKTYSEAGPTNASGDLDVLYPGIHDIDPGIVEAALALGKGQVSGPVRSYDGYRILQAVSTSDAPEQGEQAAYQAARDAYTDEQSQFLSPKFVVSLMDKSRLTFATDADCDPLPGQPLPEAAATVDGHVIPMKDVAAKCLAEDGPQVVDILVQDRLVDDECRRRAIIVPSVRIDQRLEKLRKLIAPHTLEEGLAARHMTLPELRYDFQQDIERTELVAGQVSPAKMAHCRAILVKFQQQNDLTVPSGTVRTDSQALAVIKNIQAQLRQGKDFGSLATRYSEMEPKTNKGDLGILYPGLQNMDTGVLNAGLVLGRGAITAEPVKTVIGYGLVQSLSTSSDHPQSEGAAYAEALSVYQEQAAQALVPEAIIALIKKGRVIYYLHA